MTILIGVSGDVLLREGGRQPRTGSIRGAPAPPGTRFPGGRPSTPPSSRWRASSLGVSLGRFAVLTLSAAAASPPPPFRLGISRGRGGRRRGGFTRRGSRRTPRTTRAPGPATPSHAPEALHGLVGQFGELLFRYWLGEVASPRFEHPPHGAVLDFFGVELTVAVPIETTEEILGIESPPATKTPAGGTPGALGPGVGSATGDTDRTCCPE